MVRLFTALALPPDIADSLVRRQTGLPGAAWRPVEALHITLSFYGEMTLRQADDLDGELVRAAGHGPLTLSLSGVGAFGDGHRAHAVWAGVAPNDALHQLAARCEAAGRRAGLNPPRRAYHPHVTLAYLKGDARPDRVGAWVQGHNLLQSPPFRLDHFGLYSSVTGPHGGTYRLEQEYPL